MAGGGHRKGRLQGLCNLSENFHLVLVCGSFFQLLKGGGAGSLSSTVDSCCFILSSVIAGNNDNNWFIYMYMPRCKFEVIL